MTPLKGKIVVPEGMLSAFKAGRGHQEFGDFTQEYRLGLEYALRWLSENPIVPTDEQTREIFGGARQQALSESIRIWIGRMFLGPDPIPEAIKDLTVGIIGGIPDYTCSRERFNASIIEAYRRGREGK